MISSISRFNYPHQHILERAEEADSPKNHPKSGFLRRLPRAEALCEKVSRTGRNPLGFRIRKVNILIVERNRSSRTIWIVESLPVLYRDVMTSRTRPDAVNVSHEPTSLRNNNKI
ncbi:hypothetical protein HZH66_000621 [Vespula vulgaris]|uniref:Uncharacterized protein n=2 Tax=Vespula TaxID=7451 RepID=A0A834NJX4_VESVU|nr:hypothetical protein HZH66_000621 [Vespula vulgaris]